MSSEDSSQAAVAASPAVAPVVAGSSPVTVSPAVYAATVKLPDFWQHDPEPWFQHVEAQFHLRGITLDDTKYFHVVAALDSASTRRLMGLLRDPPHVNKYKTLKENLLRLYQLSDMERADRLLSLDGLGDCKPTELMENMLTLLGSGDTSFLFTHLFLRQLPPPVRTALASSPLVRAKDYRGLAEEADRILLASRQYSVHALLPAAPGKRESRRSLAAVCAGSSDYQLLFIEDASSGRRLLVDSGAQRSIMPASAADKLGQSHGPPLGAANGTPIRTFGTRLLVHIANRCLIDAVSFDTYPCTLGGPGPLPLANMLATGDEYQRLLAEFSTLTVPTFSAAVAKHGVEHYITTAGPPVFARVRRLDAAKLAIAREEFANMERLGIVRRSNSPWASPLHMVPKADGGWRPCGDFRRLNNATTNDRYPVPHIQDFSAHLAGAIVFSKVDLVRGYHQVPVNAQDVPKTAVITPFGLFEFLRMPFGLKGAAQTFQRLMDSVLRDMPFLFVYLDDILVASSSVEEHMTHLRQLFQRLSDHGLIVNPTKCQFGLPVIVKCFQKSLHLCPHTWKRIVPTVEDLSFSLRRSH
ncbi:hypothetical protein WMY93_032223 [Mugilogobius chulae]|uniref:ribonuclease H n=1 Tax=Mugilogobius chulae TaxID=88201 RepID=A0AAW0MKK8_9GOBI